MKTFTASPARSTSKPSVVTKVRLAALLLATTLALAAPFAASSTTHAQDTLAAPEDALPVPADVQLHVADAVTLDGGALQVSLVQVVEDSRCPANVTCISAGRGLVDLRVTIDGVDKGEVTAGLVPSPEGQCPPDLDAVVERYVFSLVDLQPYPRAGLDQPLDQRLATIHVALNTPLHDGCAGLRVIRETAVASVAQPRAAGVVAQFQDVLYRGDRIWAATRVTTGSHEPPSRRHRGPLPAPRRTAPTLQCSAASSGGGRGHASGSGR